MSRVIIIVSSSYHTFHLLPLLFFSEVIRLSDAHYEDKETGDGLLKYLLTVYIRTYNIITFQFQFQPKPTSYTLHAHKQSIHLYINSFLHFPQRHTHTHTAPTTKLHTHTCTSKRKPVPQPVRYVNLTILFLYMI